MLPIVRAAIQHGIARTDVLNMPVLIFRCNDRVSLVVVTVGGTEEMAEFVYIELTAFEDGRRPRDSTTSLLEAPCGVWLRFKGVIVIYSGLQTT